MLVACAGSGAADVGPDLDTVMTGDLGDLPGHPGMDACQPPASRDLAGPAVEIPDLDVPTQPCALPNLEGRFYRFSRFDVDRPAGPEGALASTLTSLWKTEIDADQLNIVYHVTRHDPDTGEMDIEAGTAVRVKDGPDAGKYRMTSDPPPGVLKVRLDGCAFRSRSPGKLVVFPDLLTVPLDILDTWTEGVLAPDGSRVEQGFLAGGICTDMARQQYFTLAPGMSGCSNLFAFMDDLGVEPNRDDLPCGPCSGSGYDFVGRFDAPANGDFASQPGPAERTFQCQ
jgi:hypothetical protein